MSFMIQAFTDLLESFVKSEELDPELWGSLVQVLGKSFEVDEAGTVLTSLISRYSPKPTHRSLNSVLARRSSQTDLRASHFPNPRRVRLLHRDRW